MRHLLILVFLIICSVAWTQKGYKLIHKAEAKIEKGRYQKALDLLDRAENSNYGFCGNAWLEAYDAIAVNRIKVYNQLEEWKKAGDLINSMDSYMFRPELDSLKTIYYVNEFGKELIKKEIDSCINTLKPGLMDSIHVMVSLPLHVSFLEEPFTLSSTTLAAIFKDTSAYINKHSGEGFFETFKASIRRQPFYKILD